MAASDRETFKGIDFSPEAVARDLERAQTGMCRLCDRFSSHHLDDITKKFCAEGMQQNVAAMQRGWCAIAIVNGVEGKLFSGGGFEARHA